MLELKEMVPDYSVSKELLQLMMEPGLNRLSEAVSRDCETKFRADGFAPAPSVGAACYRELL